MNWRHEQSDRNLPQLMAMSLVRRAFTLVELLMVIAIIAIMLALLGAVIGGSIRQAREAATATLLQKLDALLDERAKGFDRATKTPDFQRVVEARRAALQANGVFGVSPKVLAAVARKDFFRANFPQRFEDLPSPDANMNGVPDVLESLPGVNLTVLAGQAGTNPRHETESSELLYYMLTRMQVFGVPPVGDTDFTTSEVRDTDGDGLPEFIDAWGRPLRFYRWPTRLLKPNGPFGPDGVPGNGGSSLAAYGFVGTDDVSIGLPTMPVDMRKIGGLLITGLPSAPALPQQTWDPLSEDPDDPYGLIATEIVRLAASGTMVMNGAYGFNEINYPTLDTYHTPLLVSAGADGDLGLFEPYQVTVTAASGPYGAVVEDAGILAQPRHGPGGPFDITSALTPLGNLVTSALADNLTNRNRRAGKGK